MVSVRPNPAAHLDDELRWGREFIYSGNAATVPVSAGSVGGGHPHLCAGALPSLAAGACLWLFFVYFQMSVSSVECLWCSCCTDKQRGWPCSLYSQELLLAMQAFPIWWDTYKPTYCRNGPSRSHQSNRGLLTESALILDVVCGHRALIWEIHSKEQRNKILSTRSAEGGLSLHLCVWKVSQAKKALGTATPQTNCEYKRCKTCMFCHRTGMELYIK